MAESEYSPVVRVLVIADDALVRAGLAALLGDVPGIAVVGQSAAGDDLGDLAAPYAPNVIVWDLGWDAEAVLARMDGLDEAGVPVIALLSGEDAAAPAWNAGARSLLLRQAELDPLVAALRAAALGLVVLDLALAEAALVPHADPPTDPGALLTLREADVLRLLAEGLANKAIAQRLDISEHTVKFHVNSLLRKLDAQSRTEAVIEATRRGLILL
ncbi:response regulator transcription factor [Aggregatilinea lenta]|uniref:response regulator transcription factor n=1 Tax=Aggregatilinea lenta TaxID=913108 RepID=UPI000E5C267F|nr:response regulator transcription factor [Aggregatilinea lenta]